MTTITDFLLARIAEDEAVAAAALTAMNRLDDAFEREDGSLPGWNAWSNPGATASGPEIRQLVLRYDPARVLAECAAKRAIVAAITQFVGTTTLTYDLATGLDEAVGRMAAVYADHPDFESGWAL